MDAHADLDAENIVRRAGEFRIFAPVPRLRPETPDEIRRHDNARLRVDARKELVRKLRAEPR